MKELGERAVRAKAFKPMNGMLMRSPMSLSRTWRMDQGDHNGTWDDHDKENWYLDLNDAASVGCLLAVVREAWKDPTLFVYSNGYTCAVQGAWRGPFFESETEAEALVKALEAAP